MIIAVAPWRGRHCDKFWTECVANSGLQLWLQDEVLERGNAQDGIVSSGCRVISSPGRISLKKKNEGSSFARGKKKKKDSEK